MRGFAGTVTEVALRPAAFFRRVPETRSVSGALGFAAACAVISTAMTELLRLAGISGDWSGAFGALKLIGLAGVFWLTFVLALTGLLHLLVRLLAGRRQRGLGVTLKISCYGSAAQLGSWIPYLGWLFDLYLFYLLMVGVREAHRADEDRAIVVVLVPLFLVFVGLVVFSILRMRAAFDLPL